MTTNHETKLTDITIYGINKHLGISKKADVDIFGAALINFNIDVQVKEWGLNGIYLNIDKIGIEFEYEIEIDEMEQSDFDKLIKSGCTSSEFTLYGSFELSTESFTIKNEIELRDGVLQIQDLTIDFDKNGIEIS
jgi:hypothetical protein